ncbi:NAD(P)/FAD-dependent oxidoreductase [Acidithiobacillus montserratensis]|uniref:NAD(P)/FAD-dependent oxidoreductase n=1 Tax=Acidithiobacillus montserratensis TaxID=2729135 RepID=A0ACD5HFV4_9PROT|nr:NAD(P)/FAD-dependent oxidoreductase [Acidithiobacillus montserratensis]MBN2680090.1 NAD(P)/FAD-dependent oxidoreductase [Acidithiobacillaceae bacterium]MBU2749007.1 NAD(P)/FAD-dependent oxidoreductase [Acidithiobacillus montserratensis]
MAEHTEVFIIGAGAAGLMCAITAGQRSRRVILVDHANRIGKKILMSGGGHCNFTNTTVSAQHYLSANRHFVKSALARYTPEHFIALVQKHQIAFHEKESGQLFCDQSSKQIVAMLEQECVATGHVKIRTQCSLLSCRKEDGIFHMETSQGAFTAESLVIATGGLSIPSLGATGLGYQLGRQFGHSVQTTRPGLVPLTFTGRPLEQWRGLAGVSLATVETRLQKQRFRAGLLFTHRGLSGPAILQISSFWQEGNPLDIQLLPETDLSAHLLRQKKRQPQLSLKNALSELLPKSLAQHLSEQYPLQQNLGNYTDAELVSLAPQLQNWSVLPSGSEGYRKAEVTLGGIDTSQLSSSSMESQLVSGLYFIGEVVDVTGWLGGYNFQWAWASGHAAGMQV